MAVHTLPTAKKPPGYRVSARGSDRAEILLYGVIGQDWYGEGITAKQFRSDLKALGSIKSIDVRINSEGGDVFDGKAIYAALQDHAAQVTVYVDGLAASAASFIAMAGDEIIVAEGGFFMLHNAWTLAVGNSDNLRQQAALLDSVDETLVATYAARTGKSAATVKGWMAAETWFSGPEALDAGLADRVVENKRVAAKVSDPAKFRNLPAALHPMKARRNDLVARIRSTIAR